MRFTNWTHRIARLLSSARPRPALRPRKARRGVVSAESLESRTLLTTMFYVDFGTALPAAGISTTVEDFRDLDGAGTNGFGTGSDLQGYGGLGNSDQLDFNPMQYDFNGDSVINSSDALALHQVEHSTRSTSRWSESDPRASWTSSTPCRTTIRGWPGLTVSVNTTPTTS